MFLSTSSKSPSIFAVSNARYSYFLAYSECLTPNDKPGTCMELTSCSTLYHLMLTRGKENSVANFLRSSQCGLTHDKTPKVCCPPYEYAPPSTVTRVSSTSPQYTPRPSSNADADILECGRTTRNFTQKIVGGVNASLGAVYYEFLSSAVGRCFMKDEI